MKLGKLASIAFTVALCLAVFVVVNLIHFRFLPVHVVLYSALLDTVIAGVIAAVACAAWLRHRLAASREEIGLSIVIGVLLAAFYSLSVPTVVDRSLSIYILEKLAQRGGGIRQDAMPDVLKNEYFPEHQLVNIRLTEQLNSGTIRIENGCVRLTNRGRLIASLTRAYRTTLLPKRREILGRMTDDLTDPFRNSIAQVTYTCE